MTIQAYYRPETLSEAVQLLNRSEVDSAILAGGTSLVASTEATEVIDLQLLPLKDIQVTDDSIRLGAMLSLQALVDAEELPAFIRDMAQKEEVNTFRNAGTLGGLVARADNDSELYATLLVYEAQLHYEDADGSHLMDLADYTGDGVGNAGIITGVVVKNAGTASYARVARTPADKPIVAVVGRKHGEKPLLAGCGLANTPILFTSDQIDSITPPADFRGSSQYRRQMATVLSQRVLQEING